MNSMDASTLRTEHMRRLVAEIGGPTEWARRYGGDRWTQAQVSQWISDSKPKGIGGNLARDLETAMGMPRGILDLPQHALVAQSQPARLDPQKVREAHESVRAIYELEGKVYDIEAEPDLFATVYEQLVQIIGRPSIAEMTRIGRVIEERQQGATNGRQERPERVGSTHSEKGQKSARK